MSDPFVFDHNRLFNEPTMEQHGSHMIIKNVQKPEKTKYVTIDTCFRDQYDTSLLAKVGTNLFNNHLQYGRKTENQCIPSTSKALSKPFKAPLLQSCP